LKQQKKAIALFSGGLDSILSVVWMQNLGFTVFPFFFKTPFFTEERALHSAQVNNLPLTVIDISQEYLVMLQKPVYGFGKNFNPCIDCHGLMFREAGKLLTEYGADFLISGEVLSQRPMSQRKDSLQAVGKLSGYKDLLIRPLSQKLLPDTLPIREGWIDKNDLLDISGRSRKPQLALARRLGIKEFPSPAGGCSLTDKNFSRRLQDLWQHNQINLEDINLLKYGRHFRLNSFSKLIIGRDEADNQNLIEHNFDGIFMLHNKIPGPLGLLCSSNVTKDLISLAASLLAYYYKKAENPVTVNYGQNLSGKEEITVDKANPALVQALMIRG